jgi:hypothetical protein
MTVPDSDLITDACGCLTLFVNPDSARRFCLAVGF